MMRHVFTSTAVSLAAAFPLSIPDLVASTSSSNLVFLKTRHIFNLPKLQQQQRWASSSIPRGGNSDDVNDKQAKSSTSYVTLAEPAPGTPFHHAFPVHDLDAAKHFYGQSESMLYPQLFQCSQLPWFYLLSQTFVNIFTQLSPWMF